MIQFYFESLALIVGMMTLLWIVSIFLEDVSIVDLFWGMGFVMVNSYLFFQTATYSPRQVLLFILVAIWGLRLSLYLAWRNIGKGEDFRYREFRRNYGPKRYWWISYVQTFLLQGILMWIIALPLAGVNLFEAPEQLTWLDFAGITVWTIGLIFEAGGDFQLAAFKKNPANKGKVLDRGLWRYTRHPNYFGDAAIWWGYGLFCLAAGQYWWVIGSLLMTFLILKVSGVTLLEKSLSDQKPEYRDYIQRTSAFLPWFPKKRKA